MDKGVGHMVIWVIAFIIMINFIIFILITPMILKKVKNFNRKINTYDDKSTSKEEVKKVDEVFGDIEDVWAKYDKK